MKSNEMKVNALQELVSVPVRPTSIGPASIVSEVSSSNGQSTVRNASGEQVTYSMAPTELAYSLLLKAFQKAPKIEAVANENGGFDFKMFKKQPAPDLGSNSSSDLRPSLNGK